MNKSARYSPEVRERAVWLVFEYHGEYESQWAAMGSIGKEKVQSTLFSETSRKCALPPLTLLFSSNKHRLIPEALLHIANASLFTIKQDL